MIKLVLEWSIIIWSSIHMSFKKSKSDYCKLNFGMMIILYSMSTYSEYLFYYFLKSKNK